MLHPLYKCKINIHVGDFQVGCVYLNSFLDVTEYLIFAFDIHQTIRTKQRELFLVNEILKNVSSYTHR